MVMIEKIKKDLQCILSEFRYEHSLMVADEAKKLASNYGIDESKAYVTALLHDIAKEYSDEENMKWVNKYSLDKMWLDEKNKKVIHAEIGALVAKELYNMDNDVCQAIKYHALGNPNMTILDKIIFIADKYARKNTNEFIDELKKLAYYDLDEAIVKYLENLKNRLAKDGIFFNKTSDDTLKSLKK